MGFLDDIKKLKKAAESLSGLEDELRYLKKHDFFTRFEELIKNMEEMTKYMSHFNSTMNKMSENMENMLTLNKTMDKMSQNMEIMLTYTKELVKNTEGMLNMMEQLNDNIVSFNTNIKNIAENIETLNDLEKRISLPGFIISSVKDIFVLLNQLIRIAILRNIERIKNLTKK